MNRKLKTVLKICFILYVILMLWLLFGQRMGRDLFGTYWEVFESNINLTPFRTIRSFINTVSGTDYGYAFRHSVINLAGNIVMFIPLGFFIPCVFKKQSTFGRCMLFCAISVIIIELVQLFTLLGSCDIDDLILNMIGAAVGYEIYLPVKKVLKNDWRK